MYAIDRIDFGETYINRENFEAMQASMPGQESQESEALTGSMDYMNIPIPTWYISSK